MSNDISLELARIADELKDRAHEQLPFECRGPSGTYICDSCCEPYEKDPCIVQVTKDGTVPPPTRCLYGVKVSPQWKPAVVQGKKAS